MTIIGMIYFYTIFLLWTYVDMITTDCKGSNGNSEKFISGLDMLTQKCHGTQAAVALALF